MLYRCTSSCVSHVKVVLLVSVLDVTHALFNLVILAKTTKFFVHLRHNNRVIVYKSVMYTCTQVYVYTYTVVCIHIL